MAFSLVLVLALTWSGWLFSQRVAFARQLGTTMVVLLLGFLVTNLFGWQPDARASSWISGPLTSLAIAQLLLAVDLRRIWPDARRLLLPFITAVLCTLIAVLVGALLFQPWLGSDAGLLAGVFTATFTGGSLNFVSVARTLTPPEPLLLLAMAADHVAFAAWFGISVLIGRRWGRSRRSATTSDPANGTAEPMALDSSNILFGLFWSGGVLLIAEGITALIQIIWSGCPSILVLTTVALLAAQLPGAASRSGCYGLGLLLIQPFFMVIGLSSPVGGLLGAGFPVLLYAVWIVAIQGGTLLLFRHWRRWPLTECLVASQAAIGGPSTALALATSLESAPLAMPGVAIGLCGYLIGTYLGLLSASLLSIS